MDVRLIYRAADMDAAAPVIFLVGESEERAAGLLAAVQKAKWNCALAAVPVSDWNAQLSPWPGKAVFRGGEDFAGGADAFFDALMAEVPRILREAGSDCACIMGYSLAGLFALYAATKTDAFARVAALSPSVWYEGFLDYFAKNLPAKGRFYLSLGRKEEKTGNAVLRTVGDNLRAVQQMLGEDVPLAMHDGGHYTDVEKRMIAAIEWLIKAD